MPTYPGKQLQTGIYGRSNIVRGVFFSRGFVTYHCFRVTHSTILARFQSAERYVAQRTCISGTARAGEVVAGGHICWRRHTVRTKFKATGELNSPTRRTASTHCIHPSNGNHCDTADSRTSPAGRHRTAVPHTPPCTCT